MAAGSGPRLAPASDGRPKQLVMLLHGYGADGNDLIELGRAWQHWLPDAAFFAPHAPDPLPYEAAAGRQWFPLTMRDPHERWRGVNAAAPGLDGLIDAELAAHGLGARHLALVGFSQGTMMALHVGLRRPAPIAAIVGLSGLLVLQDGTGPESLASTVRSRPPILLTMAARTRSSRLRRSSCRPRRSRRPAYPVNGISRQGSGTGLTTARSGMRACFSPAHSGCRSRAEGRTCGPATLW